MPIHARLIVFRPRDWYIGTQGIHSYIVASGGVDGRCPVENFKNGGVNSGVVGYVLWGLQLGRAHGIAGGLGAWRLLLSLFLDQSVSDKSPTVERAYRGKEVIDRIHQIIPPTLQHHQLTDELAHNRGVSSSRTVSPITRRYSRADIYLSLLNTSSMHHRSWRLRQ